MTYKEARKSGKNPVLSWLPGFLILLWVELKMGKLLSSRSIVVAHWLTPVFLIPNPDRRANAVDAVGRGSRRAI